MGGSIRIVLLLLGVLLAEVTLQAATAVFPSVEARLSGLKPRYVADPVLDVRGDPTLTDYDEAGFRNAARPPQATIVAIGDSQTEGSGVARQEAWPQQLASMAATDVYQMAFGSYGPGHYRALVDDALALQPDTIIVAVYTGNDLAGMYEWVYAKRRDAALRSTDRAVLAEVDRAERERGPIDRTWRDTRDAEKGLLGRPVLRWLRNDVEARSKLVALYEQLTWRLSGRAEVPESASGSSDWDENLRTLAGAPHDLLFPYDDGTVRTVFTPSARLSAQDLSDPRIAEGLRMTLSSLERIAEICRGRARLFVLLIPTKEMVFSRRVMDHGRGVPQAFTRVVEAERVIRERILRFLDERGIARIDAYELLRETLYTEAPLVPERRPYPESWDGHPAAAGHEAIATAAQIALFPDSRLAVCP